MRRILQESLLTAKQEEEKRTKPEEAKKPESQNGQTEEEYLLQCMQKVGIEEGGASVD